MPTVPPTVAAGLANPEALHRDRHPHRPADEPSGDGYPIQQRPRRSESDGTGRMPPQDNDTERALLGAMLASPEALHAAAVVLPPDPFYTAIAGTDWHSSQDEAG